MSLNAVCGNPPIVDRVVCNCNFLSRHIRQHFIACKYVALNSGRPICTCNFLPLKPGHDICMR